MARPLRIEFAGGWYHVMNRGAGQRTVFPSDACRFGFLKLLAEIHERYQVETHAWCLMDNHYHLLLRTPLPNLARAMRHVDGVYTQHHNRLNETDGPLFRGRYLSIVVDDDGYLAQLSRYIHRNPLEAGLVERAEDWQWSSYRAYFEARSTFAAAPWLHTERILGLFPARRARHRYRAFVEHGLDEETRKFYAEVPLAPAFGSERFRLTLQKKFASARYDDNEIPSHRQLRKTPELDCIIDATACAFGLERAALVRARRGRNNLARAIAMQLCRSPGGFALKTIAEVFGLKSYAGVSMAITRLKARLDDPELLERVERLKRDLFGVV